MKKYLPSNFESHWIKIWESEKVYKTTHSKNKEKKYILDMFPYPSGAGLHVGHPRGYTATDILSRYYRLNGYNVLHPMGWDAFGLPAENAAIKAKTNPKKIVPENIENFKRQMKMLGFSYDWDREFSTTDTTYFKWTQWLFIQFFKMGLLYKKNTPINYCSTCKTGLAEEEVLPDGSHERCGKPIVKKELPQWIFRITKYADELLQSLEGLEWPRGILEMQRNWIGKKEGVNIDYMIKGHKDVVTCFTTRPETNFGATFVVVAPEHEIVQKILDGKEYRLQIGEETVSKIREYVAQSQSKKTREREMENKVKTGVNTNLTVVNKLNNKEIPLYVSDFVLSGFGTGAVVGVPAHDTRDYDFALSFNLPVVSVVVGNSATELPTKNTSSVYEGEGIMVNSEFLNGLSTQEAKKQIISYLVEKGWGESKTSYHLRDWIFSRQRYWGEPIPIIFCKTCHKNKVSYFETIKNSHDSDKISDFRQEVKDDLYGYFPLSEKELPLDLPDVNNYEPLESGKSPLAGMPTFVNTVCPHCKGAAERETDTMPNWAGSCWYFLYFARNEEEGAKKQADLDMKSYWEQSLRRDFDKFMPVDWYMGGAEHAVLHLLYARFFMHAMYDINLVSHQEPFFRLRNVGMILAEDNRKMSKSLGNVINPDDVVREYGADALRLYEMFMAPFSQEITWSTRTLQGTYRFLKRIYNLSVAYENYENEVDYTIGEYSMLSNKLAQTIQKVAGDIVEIKFNTAVASMMEFLNLWEEVAKKNKFALSKDDLSSFLRILSPFAPFMTEEIWRNVLKNKVSIHSGDWPIVESSKLQKQEIVLPIQINGKMRSTINVTVHSTQEEIQIKALTDPVVKKHIGERKIIKTIYVPSKIINFIV